MKKRILSLAICVCMIASLLTGLTVTVGAATSGKCGDNLTWVLDDAGTLSISGTGDMWYYEPWYDYRESIKRVFIADGVTSISAGMFSDCTSLKSVTIPDSVTAIESNAFCDCTALTSITIPNSVTSIGSAAFYGCTALESIILSDSVTTLGGGVFIGCSALKEITIPNGVTKLRFDEFDLFVGCTSLTAIYVSEQHTAFSSVDGVLYNKDKTTLICCPGGKSGSFTIPDSVITIGGNAFRSCKGLTEISIPNSVTSIEGSAFNKCSAITSIVIPASVTSIGSAAFYGCTALTDVYYSGTEAQWNALEIGVDNEWLTDATIHYEWKTEPEIVASGVCGDNLTWVLDDAGVLTISGTGAMTGYGYDNSPWNNNGGVKAVVIGDGVTSIGACAFFNCKALTEITIPDGVTSIGNWAFYGCKALTDVFYGGTEAQWGTLAIGGGNDCLTGATVHGAEPEIIASGTCGTNLTWTLDEDGRLTISGTGAMTDWSSYSSVPWYNYRSSIKTVVIGDSVTSIGNGAFAWCYALTEITIPDSVTSIGNGAFEGCAALTSAVIGDGVTSIGDFAFYDCSSLASMVIPDSVTSIGNAAFYGCSSLTSIKIPDGVTSIGGSAFYDCKALTSIVIPDSVTSIGGSAFEGCTALTSIVIPDSVTSIGNYAFEYCKALESVVIGDGVTSIGYGAFYGCTSLTEIVIPNGVTSVGGETFNGCTALKSVTLGDGVTSIGKFAFYDCTALTSIVIPDSVTSIGERAFCSCHNLASVVIGDGVTSIGDYAFSYCKALTDVYYSGTEAQWNAITIGSSNAPLTNATLHFHEHSWDVFVAVAPTCTEPGEMLCTCPVCGATKIEVLPALGHVYDGDEDAICNVCGFNRMPAATVLGDVNGDGSINTVDANLALMFYVDAASNPLDETQQLAADVDGNGVVNTVDANLILLHYVGICSAACPLHTASGQRSDEIAIPTTWEEFQALSKKQQYLLELQLGEEEYNELVQSLQKEHSEREWEISEKPINLDQFD